MRKLQVIAAAELAAAYAAAGYCVLLDGEALPLRVGQTAEDLEAYWPARRYNFITAWNPASQPRSDAANATADALLVARLDQLRATRHPAWAESPDGDWREPGWLLADIEPDQCIRLAREFGQAGVLNWERGQPVRLWMMLARPLKSGTAACVDWVGD